MEESVESEIQKESFSGEVEGLRSIGLEAAKELLRGKSFDDVFSSFVKLTVENLLERVVDPFLTYTKTEAQKIDPVGVPVGHFNISNQFFCLPLTGVVDIEEGKINNLSAIQKSDDCVVDVQGRILFVRLKLQISDVNYQANSRLDLLCSNSAFLLKSVLASISINVELRVDFSSLTNLSAEISKFNFSMNGFDAGVTGDAIPELLSESIKHYYLQEYKNFMQDLSLEKLKECMEVAVKNLVPILNSQSRN